MIFRRWFSAWLKAHGQIVLSDRIGPGVLVILAILLISPFGALGAMAGALAGTAYGWLSSNRDDAVWDAGIYGVNPAIVGIMWGGPLSYGNASATLFVLAVLGALLADAPIRNRLYRLGVPALSVTAVLIGWASHWVFQSFGASFWAQQGLLPVGSTGVYAAGLLVFLAIAWHRLHAALAAGSFALLGAIASAALWGQPFGAPALWAFSIAPAAIIPFAFLEERRYAAFKASSIAALIATIAWWAWSVPGFTTFPPLLAPAVVGAWIGIRFVIRKGGLRVLDRQIWQAAAAIENSLGKGKPVVVLSGAGVSTSSGIPDYVSGAWFDPRVPATNYGFDVFKASRKCRVAYWEACARFRSTARAAAPGPAHLSLAQMQERGIVSAVITQNVDGLHQSAGSTQVVELHGNIEEKRCLKCHRVSPWEDELDWHDEDVCCPKCGGLLKPAVIAFGEDIPPKAWREASEAVKEAGVMLIVGTQLSVSSAVQLLGMARRNDAQVVFVNEGPVSQPVLEGDIFLAGKAEAILPAMQWVLTQDKRPQETPALSRMVTENPG